tara:strand:- start:14333 stop:15370 length:1038 start_codon:yes stop_codon:yes gene_type:complete
MKVLVTGSLGLIGSTISNFYIQKDIEVIGIDNDQRKIFFGDDASNLSNLELLSQNKNYSHFDIDIRDSKHFKEILLSNKEIDLIVHCAAQPSHDWARDNKFDDFEINAVATLNLLELVKENLNDSIFVNMSTNKVYGDNPNKLDLKRKEKRFDLSEGDKYFNGIDTTMSIDQNLHSFFGISKLTSDLLVQEFGKTYGMKTISLRGGCLTGGNHNGAKAHGFLSYLIKCIENSSEYIIEGYEGLQVRDNIHSEDVANLVEEIRKDPGIGEVYNLGGGRDNSISVIEAIEKAEKILDKKAKFQISNENRLGDHKWYITDNKSLFNRFPNWKIRKDLDYIFEDIIRNS